MVNTSDCSCKAGGGFYRYFWEQGWDCYLPRRKKGALKTSTGCSGKENHPTEQREKVLHKRHGHAIYRQVVRMQLFASSGWKSLCFGEENAVYIWNQNNDCFESTAQAFLEENYREVQFLHCWLQAFVSRLTRDSWYPALDKHGTPTWRCQCNLMI